MNKKVVKIIKVFVMFTVIFFAYGCSGHKISNEKMSVNNYDENEDKISSSPIIEIDISNKKIIDGSDYIKTQGCFKYPLNIESYIQESSDIVAGEVIEVGYVEVDRIPWTKIDVQVAENIKGDIGVGEIITIYELGGYVTGNSFKEMYGQRENIKIEKEDLVEMKYFQTDMHSAGEEGIYCIKSRDEKSVFSKYTYELVCSSYSEFRYSNDENAYCMRNSDGMEYITMDDLKNRIQKTDALK